MKLFPCLARPHTDTTPTGPLCARSTLLASSPTVKVPSASQVMSCNGRAIAASLSYDIFREYGRELVMVPALSLCTRTTIKVTVCHTRPLNEQSELSEGSAGSVGADCTS
eukprot:239041-Prorocentrum_minimum.AAC.2